MMQMKDNERAMLKRCRETKAEIDVARAKISTCISTVQEQKGLQEDKQNEIKNTWSLMDQVLKSIKEHEERIEKANEEFKLVNQRISEASKQEAAERKRAHNTKKQEREEKDAILKQKQREYSDLKFANDQLMVEVGALETECLKHRNENQELKDSIIRMHELTEEKKDQLKDVERNKLETELKIQEAKKNLQNTINEITEAKAELEKENKKWQKEVKERDDKKKKIQQEENRIKGLQKEIEKLKLNNETVKLQLQDQDDKIAFEQSNITNCDREKAKLDIEFKALANLKGQINSEIERLTQEKEVIEVHLRAEKEVLDKESKDLNEKEEVEEKEMKNKGAMESDLKDTKNEIYKQDMDCHQLESQAKKLQNQIKGYENESLKINQIIRDLQEQQKKYGQEATTAHARFLQTVEELQIKHSIIEELKKKNVDLENKLKHQQNLYEAVRSDRNLYSKNLLEAQQESSVLGKKYMMMLHQISQLKEEIKVKDKQFIKEFNLFKNAEKQKKATEIKEQAIQARIDSTKQFIKHHENQIAKLKYIIAEAQAEKQKQMKDHEMVLNERDILGAQLIKRNQELESLYEKIKIAQSNLAKGEKHYRDEQAELAELKEKLINLRQELQDSTEAVANEGQFKSEINNLEKEILKCKTKNRALEDELKYPMNVHPWKKMEATDPENYERIMKIQTLLRRVITKTEEVGEKDRLIKEKEQLFFQLKNILARQPGPETFRQIEIYEASLKDKTSQLKKFLGELKETQAKIKGHKYEIGLVNQQISEIKQDYFKMRDMEEKGKLKELQTSQVPKSTMDKQAYYESLGIQPGLALGFTQGGATPTVTGSIGGTGTIGIATTGTIQPAA